MIVALTGMDGNRDVSDLAEELALLRVAAGNRAVSYTHLTLPTKA